MRLGTTVLFCLLLSSGCFRGLSEDAARVDIAASSMSDGRSEPPRGSIDELLDRPELLVVPPDRAVVRIEVGVEGGTPSEVGDRLGLLDDNLVGTVSTPSCEVALHDRTAVGNYRDTWSAHAVYRLDIDLRESESTRARGDRIDECLLAVHAIDADDSMPGVRLRLGTPTLDVADPQQHVTELLRRRFAPLHTVSNVSGTPAVFASDLLNCTSHGHVHIARRALSGVTLDVDFACTPSAPVTKLAAAAANPE